METRLPSVDTSPSPAAFHYSAGHMIVHGNAAFLETFGSTSLRQPAREALIGLPPQAFALMDRVYQEGKPLALRITTPWGARRLVVGARRDPETGETYGVTTHLRPVPAADPESGR